ncbi:DUF1801 domain-containing protein [Mucilaginibacter pedocola]|uniref:YdhG-like domain-containing protein n=1 Tax=Mucilaginibacter pedocola TaxID=1792845 RepID=A0A1S9P8D2_9SPHI|nr:DUF1801 domain-containing protein [Mucilaginibacter pedocola]OOQ57192.1 hypothetical protein BC343_16875 [Mucilaginibacter pedocola]
MYELKTKDTGTPAHDFLAKVEDEAIRRDCFAIAKMMEDATGKPAIMWGTAIVGCDSYHYKYASGHEGDMCLIGFSPRKSNIALYLAPGDEERAELLPKLGKHKMAKACLYIKKLADVDTSVLSELITRSVASMRERYP